MKPTQEQVIAWARDTGCLNIGDYGHKTYEFEAEELKRLAALAYEAGRKDENEACAEMCEVKFDFCGDELLVADAIRARREQ
jgi:hypothetical protein